MSKSESKKGGSKSKDKKKKWNTSSTNQTTGLPMLKYGPDTNIHICLEEENPVGGDEGVRQSDLLIVDL